MKKVLVSSIAALLFGACTSVETATVSRNEIASHGEPVAVIQGTAIGFSLFLHYVDVVPADLDTVVNKLLVAEAKAMGASKVDIKQAWNSPRHGIFRVPCLLLCFPLAQASGIAVK